ncbi:MAG: ferritin-like domain-containing protein [Defluviitaleaceae bacterium]|nr:ferritin-like domain-containing protein [Defluviitaleaceae bacterium]MCL2836001.1 ferritin-like domain-containing protein [Defluviitaleaceae bacterium]
MDNAENAYHESHKPGLLDRKLLEMIAHAADGETAAVKYYTRLSDMLEGADKKTVHNIALDEAKHRRLYEELYFNIAGTRMLPPHTPPEPVEPKGSLHEIFEERLHDELSDVEFYRQIYQALLNLDYRDILFEIITDELRHANLMSQLYAKYKA